MLRRRGVREAELNAFVCLGLVVNESFKLTLRLQVC